MFVRPGPELIAITYALLRMGAVPVLIDPGMGRRSLLACVERMAPAALVGVARAHLARRLFPHAFASAGLFVAVGGGPRFGAVPLEAVERRGSDEHEVLDTAAEEPAAVLFTSGSTGPPKGVLYTHGIFAAQVEALEHLYGFTSGDVDLACFPLFALFDNALGMTSVIPRLDPSRPATVDPLRLARTIDAAGATVAFGSPAIWKRVVDRGGGRFRTLGRVLMAGAPVPPERVARLRERLAAPAQVFTPYGATECLPVSNPESAEILAPVARTAALSGRGTPIGRPVRGMRVRAIEVTDGPLARLEDAREVTPGEVGELVVTGPVVTPAYAGDASATSLAKTRDGEGRLWHRMGDLGRVERDGSLWFCGRVAHRLRLASGDLPCVPLENPFLTHPAVARVALVGVGEPGRQQAHLVVELERRVRPSADLAREVLAHGLAQLCDPPPLAGVAFHPSFPVDVRHNAKIHRLELARFVADQRARGRLALDLTDAGRP